MIVILCEASRDLSRPTKESLATDADLPGICRLFVVWDMYRNKGSNQEKCDGGGGRDLLMLDDVLLPVVLDTGSL
jgi:hypothetical protein